MVALAPTSREQMAANHARDARQRPAARAVTPANHARVVALAAPETLFYRGRAFRYRPVSWEAGIELVHACYEKDAIDDDAPPSEQYEAEKAAVARVLAALKACARPPGWRGWFWRWRANPFATATDAEIRGLISFFARARTTSSVGYRPGKT
jgi:hypothetical protein